MLIANVSNVTMSKFADELNPCLMTMAVISSTVDGVIFNDGVYLNCQIAEGDSTEQIGLNMKQVIANHYGIGVADVRIIM